MTILQNCRRLRSVVIALALLAPGAATAQSPRDAQPDQGICKTVARTVLAIDLPGSRDGWQSPLRTLAKASPAVVGIDAEGWQGKTRTDTLDRLRQEYRAEPGLLEAIGKLTSDDGAIPLFRFGGSSLHMARIIEGSASCERFQFFDAPPGGAAHPVAAPPVVRNAEPFALCYTTKAYAGEAAGVPAFIVETNQDSTAELGFTPWRDGGWQAPCKVVIRFSDVFEVTERFCKGVDCPTMADQALSLVKKVDRSPQVAEESAGSQSGPFKAMKERADKEPGDIQSFPTFGSTVHDLATAQFAPESVVLPVVVGGKTYLARVGHYAIGWRTMTDYLVAAYQMVGDRLEPVAGIYITKTRGKPVSATVD